MQALNVVLVLCLERWEEADENNDKITLYCYTARK